MHAYTALSHRTLLPRAAGACAALVAAPQLAAAMITQKFVSSGPGFGVTVDREILESLTVGAEELAAPRTMVVVG